MKGRNPLKEAKVISRLKGSRQVVAAPRGHAKSTNFTFKDSLHDRYVKTMSNSVTKASKSFAFDNIIDEQRDMLKETVEEYPAITISLADKLLRMLGLADTTSVKKL